jgi:DNA-binding MarR family transcriptional regulator
VPAQSSAPYAFGDLLALARQSWLRELEGRLDALGYPGYRRSDSASIRLLYRGPVPVGRLGAALGVTRQAARKVADGLEQRGYVTSARDPRDSRQLNISLTPAGQAYAQVLAAVIADLNREVAARVDPVQLAAADTVLRAALFDDSARWRADWLPAPAPPALPAPAPPALPAPAPPAPSESPG